MSFQNNSFTTRRFLFIQFYVTSTPLGVNTFPIEISLRIGLLTPKNKPIISLLHERNDDHLFPTQPQKS